MKNESFHNKKSKLARRITWRVILNIIFFNVLVIGAILLFVYSFSLINSSILGQDVANGISGKMENMLHSVEVAAVNNLAEVEANLDSREKVFGALEHELRLNRGYVGCFAAFEPDYFKGQGRWFEAYAYHTDSMDIGLKQIGSEKHDYFNKTWYRKGLALENTDHGYLTDPYFDDSVDSCMYCSYVLPIRDRQGRKVGVYGIDLNLSWLDETIDDQKRIVLRDFWDDPGSLTNDEDEIVFSIQVVDSKGKCIASTDSLDLSILDKEQETHFDLGMKDLKGSPYYANIKQLAHTDWQLAVFQHSDMVFLWGGILAVFILAVMGIGGIVIFFFTGRSIRKAIRPLGFLSDSAQKVAKGNFDTVLPTFKHDDEIAQLRDSFDAMQQSLKQYVEDLKESTAARAAIESELSIAHNIQMSMLPKTFPPFPERDDIELYGSLTPAKGVGGDLYDFFIRDEKLYFCIGDVSGKGVPASLVMAVTRTLFRNIAVHTAAPSHIVESMNMNICEDNDNNMFVTLFVGVLDLKDGRLRYCNAGHDIPYLASALLPCKPNLPIGVMAGFDFMEQETVVAPDAIIFLYTDGLTEAENACHDQFGEERVSGIVASFEGATHELIATMTTAVHQFVGDTEQSDDLTMLAIKYTNRKII